MLGYGPNTIFPLNLKFYSFSEGYQQNWNQLKKKKEIPISYKYCYATVGIIGWQTEAGVKQYKWKRVFVCTINPPSPLFTLIPSQKANYLTA